MMCQSGLDPKQTTVAETVAWLSHVEDESDDEDTVTQTDGVW